MSDPYTCDNCGFTAEYDALPQAKDIPQRMTPGGIYTDVECPKCCCLCFPRYPEATRSLINSLRNCLSDTKKLEMALPKTVMARLKAINHIVKKALKQQGVA